MSNYVEALKIYSIFPLKKIFVQTLFEWFITISFFYSWENVIVSLNVDVDIVNYFFSNFLIFWTMVTNISSNLLDYFKSIFFWGIIIVPTLLKCWNITSFCYKWTNYSTLVINIISTVKKHTNCICCWNEEILQLKLTGFEGFFFSSFD